MTRRVIAFGRLALSGIVVVFYNYDYISLFVPFFDVTVRLGDMFQVISSIDNWFYLLRLDQLFEEDQVFC